MPKSTHNLESHDPTIMLLAAGQTQQPTEDKLSRSLIVEPLPSTAKNLTILLDDQGCDDLNSNPTSESGPSRKSKKKKKKGKKKKKKKNLGAKDEARDKSDEERENSDSDTQVGPLSRFTSSGSPMQNKIKLVYDEFVKCHDSNQLRLMQVTIRGDVEVRELLLIRSHEVVEFSKCLSDVRSELDHRSDRIKHKYVTIMGLLHTADKSSSAHRSIFNRIGEQITKFNLELERLKGDGSAYNFIKEQFEHSPAYKKFGEIRACILERDKQLLEETRYDEFQSISFEDLLAKEKNDSFWQKNGKSGQNSSSSSNK